MRRVLVGGVLALVLAAAVADGAPPAAGGPARPPIEVTTVVDGLSIPWGLDFLPDGTMLLTERRGTWYSVAAPYDTSTPQPVAFDDTDLFVGAETGLLDLLVDPAFGTNRRVFTCQGHQEGGDPARIQVISWTLSADLSQADRLADPLVDNVTRFGRQVGRHGGCRLQFDRRGNLWIATGDGARTDNPQNLRRLGGKVLRVDPDTGEGVPGNPWAGSANANRRRLWTYGHRNLQGLARRPGTIAQFWTAEHGPTRDDEVNRLVRGGNHGWLPGPGYAEIGFPMTNLARFPRAVRAKWSSGAPTVATSGAVFLRGPAWGPWDGALVVATLKERDLRVFRFGRGGIQPPQIVGQRAGLPDRRLRTPVLGPDGALYVTTANGNGQDRVVRVAPVG